MKPKWEKNSKKSKTKINGEIYYIQDFKTQDNKCKIMLGNSNAKNQIGMNKCSESMLQFPTHTQERGRGASLIFLKGLFVELTSWMLKSFYKGYVPHPSSCTLYVISR